MFYWEIEHFYHEFFKVSLNFPQNFWGFIEFFNLKNLKSFRKIQRNLKKVLKNYMKPQKISLISSEKW